MENHRPLRLARELDRIAQNIVFLMGIDPRTRDNTSVSRHLDLIVAQAKELEAAVVGDMRDTGASWTDVAEALRTTRQSAWERFAALEYKRRNPVRDSDAT